MFDDNDSLTNTFSNLLDYFLFIIKKNKKLFILFIALTFSGSLAHVLTRKPIWLGRTSIQLKNKINLKNNNLNPTYLNFLLRSQFEIIQSKTVIEPIYNSFKEKQKLKNINKISNYEKWRRNLSFDFKRGTNLVEIIFVNNDKKLVEETLKQTLAVVEFQEEERKLNDALNNLGKSEKIINQLLKDAKTAAINLDNFLLEKGIEDYPKLLIDNTAEEFLLNNNPKGSFDPIENKKFIPPPNLIYSLKLKNLSSLDLIDLKRLETNFHIAQQRYIDSLISKNKLEGIISQVKYSSNFKDAIQLKKINQNSIKLLTKNLLLTIFGTFLIIYLVRLKKGLLFSENSFEKILSKKPSAIYSKNNEYDLSVLIDSLKEKNDPKLIFIKIDKIPNYLYTFLNSKQTFIKLISVKEASQITSSDRVILLLNKGYSNKYEINNAAVELKNIGVKELSYVLIKN